MITFKQFLQESRSAPLYHATSLGKAERIVKEDILKLGRNREPGLDKRTISLTRNLTFAKMWLKETGVWNINSGFIFEFDQRKLAQRFKIAPYNFFAGYNKSARVRPESREFSKGKDYHFDNQFEEAVLQDITNVMRYVTKVYVDYERPDFMNNYPNIQVFSYRDNKRIPD